MKRKKIKSVQGKKTPKTSKRPAKAKARRSNRKTDRKRSRPTNARRRLVGTPSAASAIAEAVRSGVWQRAIRQALAPKRVKPKKKRHSSSFLQEVIKRAVKRFKGRVSEEEIAEVIEEAKSSTKFTQRRAPEKEVKKTLRGLKLNRLEPEDAYQRIKRLQRERFPSYTIRELYSFWKSP